MPVYTPDDTKEELDKQPRRKCDGLREDLKKCLIDSDCVRIDGKSPKECLLLGPHPSVPTECQALRYAFFECKRSLLDMRTRFRGIKGY